MKGWSTFPEWTDSKEIHEIENVERENDIDENGYLLRDGYIAKWVCLKKKDAVWFMRESERSDMKKYPATKQELNRLYEIDITDAVYVDYDSDGGTLWIKKAN